MEKVPLYVPEGFWLICPYCHAARPYYERQEVTGTEPGSFECQQNKEPSQQGYLFRSGLANGQAGHSYEKKLVQG